MKKIKSILTCSLAFVMLGNILFASHIAASEEKTEKNSTVSQSSSEVVDKEAKKEVKEDFVDEFKESSGKDSSGRAIFEAIDFSLRDQNGKRHSLQDYKDKVVVLNFWQTWCGPCIQEMPEFNDIYEEFGKNEKDVVILGVSSPKNDKNKSFTNESKTDIEIKDFLIEKEVDYPSLMDYEAKLYQNYAIVAFPTTIVILPDGHIYGVAQGAINADTLRDIIKEAQEKKVLTPVGE